MSAPVEPRGALFASLYLAPGSLAVERYQPDTGGPQWLAYAVNYKGELQLIEVCTTRRAALAALTSEYAPSEREHTDV